jgi:putative transposase
MSTQSHHPPHVLVDDIWYAFTGSTYGGRRFLHPTGHKDIVRDKLKALVTEYRLRLYAWVIMDNHYHLLIKSHIGDDLSVFFRKLHGATAFEINGRDGTRGRQLWHNYWDTCIRTEADYWTRLNYIHHNPVKHGYASRMEDWPFSSYAYYLRTKGVEWLGDAFSRYPIIDYTDATDRFEGDDA